MLFPVFFLKLQTSYLKEIIKQRLLALAQSFSWNTSSGRVQRKTINFSILSHQIYFLANPGPPQLPLTVIAFCWVLMRVWHSLIAQMKLSSMVAGSNKWLGQRLPQMGNS